MNLLVTLVVLSGSPLGETGVYKLKPAAFTESVKTDAKTLHFLVNGMNSVAARIKENEKLFTAPADTVYTPEQKRTLLSTWGSLFAYFSSTEGLRQKYWDFVKLLPTDSRHSLGFVMTHAALTALLANGLKFTRLTQNNKQLETLFDEGSDEFGLPKGAFTKFKLRAVHVATSTQLMTGDVWETTVLPTLKLTKSLDDENLQWAWESMSTNSKTSRELLVNSGVKLYLGNAKDLLKDQATSAIFPVQKSFAEWAGDTRVARIGKPLITREQIDTLVLPKLSPGDIMVSRQNWFLSNIGLPGFWPHAELYVGTADDLKKAFDADPDTIAWVRQQPEKVASFTELLSKRYPEKWKAYAAGTDFQGHAPIRVIESISEGVSFTAVEHAFGVDYLGAMRPRLSVAEKARAIERAFHFQGRPYDFDFDFDSDNTLVCSELVYKSYLPGADLTGVKFGLVDVAGRRTLPVTDMVKEFDASLKSANPTMDFVVFIDAAEKEKRAFEGTEKSFRESWKRVKWDVAQK